MLLKTKVKLVLLHDLDMLNMIEKMKRSGLCFFGSKRYVKANNQRMPDYAKKQFSNYIIYQDANNLHCCSMSEYLHHKDLKWDSFMSIDIIMKILDKHWKRYRIEVDLHGPVELHDKLKEFPPALETLTPDIEELTRYQRELGANAGIIHNGLSMALIN